MSHQPYLSILIPLYDELGSIPEMHAQVSDACARLGRTYEILWIDDGSRDGSGAALDDLVTRDPRSRVVHFRRNFGKSSALAAGFERVRGQIVLTLDADLQDDPAMLDDFVRRIEAGADLVSGWKKTRHDPLDKTLPSRLFNAVVSRTTGVRLHDFNCGFKAYRADCVRELAVYGGFHRFLPVLAHHRGFRVEELIVNHRKRKHGKSKYGFMRMFDGFMDLLTVLLLTRYRTRPLHFFGIPGMLLGGAGVMILSYLTLLWLMGYAIGERPLLTLGVLLTIVAMQFVGVGLLGELLVRTTIRSQEVFSIRDEREAPANTRAAIYAQPSPQLGPSAMRTTGRELPVSAADEVGEEVSEEARTVSLGQKQNPFARRPPGAA